MSSKRPPVVVFAMALLSVLLCVLLVVPGCGKDEEVREKKQPTVKINLPPSPEMTERRFVAQYVDGSYCVEGLVKNRQELMGKEVRVKGFVREVRRCPEGEATCDPPPHAVLVDDLARPGKRLLLVGGPGTKLDRLEQGAKDTFAGIYRTTDPDGLFVRMEGVLVLADEEPPAAPEPKEEPPAPAKEEPAPPAE